MQKVRRWLTEILLDVTNEETEAVAREVMNREKRKKAKGSMTCLLNNSIKLFLPQQVFIFIEVLFLFKKINFIFVVVHFSYLIKV